jgi:hypothetical protein
MKRKRNVKGSSLRSSYFNNNSKRQVLFQEFSALKMNLEEELTPTMACWEREREREIGALKRKRKENKMMLERERLVR